MSSIHRLLSGIGIFAAVAFSQTINPANLQTAVFSAAPGAILEVGPGTYSGKLIIRKAITLRGNNTIIQAPSAAVVAVDIQADNVTLEGFSIMGTPWGVYAGDPTGTTSYTGLVLRNIEVTAETAGVSPGHGVFTRKSTNSLLDNVRIISAGVNGILLDDGSDDSIIRNSQVTITGGPDSAIKVSRSSRVHLIGNTVVDTGSDAHGILVWNSPSAVVDGNTIQNADANGIMADEGSDYAIIINNTILSTRKQQGFAIKKSSNALVAGNNVVGSGFFGMSLVGSSYSTVERNSITGAKQDGIVLTDDTPSGMHSTGNYVGKNFIVSNGFATGNPDGTGIWLNNDSNGNLVYGNVSSGAPENGLTSFNSSYNHYWGNVTSNNGHGGIFMYSPKNLSYSAGASTSYTAIQGNYAFDLPHNAGVILREATNSTVFGNFVKGPPEKTSGGISIQTSSGNRVYLNTFRDLLMGIYSYGDVTDSSYFLNRHLTQMLQYALSPTTIALDGGSGYGGNLYFGYTSTQPYTNFVNNPAGNTGVYSDRYPYASDMLGRSASVEVGLPAAGSWMAPGTRKTIEWRSSGCTYMDLSYRSAATGVVSIAAGYPDTGIYNWTVPSVAAGTDYRVVLECRNSAGQAAGATAESQPFAISKPGIELLFPQGNARLLVGGPVTIAWKKTPGIGAVNVLARTGTGSFSPVASNITDNFVVVSPAGAATTARSYLIQAAADTSVGDSTDGRVNVSGTATPAVTGPSGTVVTGTLQHVQWTSPMMSGYVDISYWDSSAGTFRNIIKYLPDRGRFYALMPDRALTGSYLRVQFWSASLTPITTADSGTFNTQAPSGSTGGGTGGGVTPAGPTADSVSPASGSGQTQVFTAVASHSSGAINLTNVYLMVGSQIDGSTACFLYYDRTANTFRLMLDTGSWSSPVTPGSAATVSSSRCTFTGSGAGAAIAGNSLNVVFPLTFRASYAGANNVYLLAQDTTGGTTGWKLKGAWTIPNATNATPQPEVGVLSPAAGTGSSGTFSAVFSHPDGAQQLYLGYVLFLPIPNIVSYTAKGSCLVEYNRISNGIRLINDAGDGWLGPISGVVITPTAVSLSNSFCTVNVRGASAVISGNTMTVNVPVTFAGGFTGVLPTFLQAVDVSDHWTGMTQMGTWTAYASGALKTGPTLVSGGPASGAGTSTTITVTASHSQSLSSMTMVHVLISPAIMGGSPCQIVYFPGSNQLNLINDSGTDMVSPTWMTPGSASGVLSNSRCTVNGTGLSRSVAGQQVSLNIPVSFNPVTFGGVKKIYMNVFDNAGLLTHWIQTGTWTVQ